MAVAASLFAFDNSYVRELAGLWEPARAAGAQDPRLLAFNPELATELGLDAGALQQPEGVAVLAGNAVPEGAASIAMAYAGHQFGGYSPRLGDGRALLLGEVLDGQGRRRDLHLKGSGRTAFSRGTSDGKAAVGPMLREFLVSEAMHALGIPTTRALAVVGTGEDVVREIMLPGALIVRVAASHLRVGTFEWAAAQGDPALLRRLADYAIARHHPAAAEAEHPDLALFAAVYDAQAELIARWLAVGFVHGVMNTDNMTISGETIDYGPCAFLDAYDPAASFSSIDHGRRYAYGNQPAIAQWNLARLAEALLPLIDADQSAAVAAATEVLERFPARHHDAWLAGMRAKLGLPGEEPEDEALVVELLGHLEGLDFTGTFRALAGSLRGEAPPLPEAWVGQWRARLGAADAERTAAGMDAANPVYVPRNHLVEEALAAATDGDLEPFEQLRAVLARPFEERAGLERYAAPGPTGGRRYQTFCGT
jgi:uncharacterized protein YdiU (UPF0061 family)